MKFAGRKAARRAVVASAMETLEGRRLLAGNVTGIVFEDANGNGVQDAGEAGIAGRTVKFVGGGYGAEVTATTNASGNYTFSGVLDGPGYLSHELPNTSWFTAPPNGMVVVNVLPNQTVTAQPLGSRVVDRNIYLDQTFGTRGESVNAATTPISAVAARQLADGRLLLAGVRDGRATISRFTSTGALDATFGGGAGFVQPNMPAGFVIKSMVLLSDERIVIGGQTPTSGDLEVAVLTQAGALDNSFAGDGHTTIDFAGSLDIFVDLARSPGDKIAVLGYRTLQSNDIETELALLNVTGSLDTNFSGDGRETYNFNASIDTPAKVAVESDGQVVVIANRQLAAKTVGVVSRINTTGVVDFTFGSGGTRVLEVSGQSLMLSGLALQTNDRALVSGESTDGTLYVHRLTTLGANDSGFGFSGRTETVFSNFAADFAMSMSSVTVNSVGNIAVGGLLTAEGQPEYVGTVLFTAAGVADDRYLEGGALAHRFEGAGANDTVANVLLQNDNKIILTSNLVDAGKLALLRTGDQTPRANIAGSVFNDLNNNGIRDNGETGFAEQVVFLDLDGNAERDAGEPSDTTDAQGNYNIDTVVATGYFLVLAVPEGFAQTYPVQEQAISLLLQPGQSLGGQNFGLRQIPPDLIANPGGPYNVNEGGSTQLFGMATGGTVTAYEWDLNYDGVTFTADSTLQNPLFSAAELDGVGTRTVALRVRQGTLATSPIASATVNIANVSPTAVISNSGPITAGQTATVTLSQANDPSAADRNAGFKYSFDFNNDGTFEIIDATAASATVPAELTAAEGTVQVKGRIKDKDGGSNDYLTTITVNAAPPPGQIAGLVFNDIDRNGTQGAGEAGIANRTVYIDTDNDGIFDDGEKSAVTAADGLYSIGSVIAGSYVVRQVVPAGFIQTVPANNAGRNVTVASGATSSNVIFATAVPPAGATLRGVVFLDGNRNGVRDSGEAGVSGRSIYLDNNNNGVRDAAEPQTATNASGVYEFGGLSAGTYKIRQILPTGFIQTTPANNFGNNATVSGTQVVDGLNFGTAENAQPTGATLRGTVFRDADRDGVFDSGETGVSGRTIYLDANNNSVLDSGERSTTTNASGVYEFGGLAAGTYKIRQVLPAGFIQTSPTNNFGNNATVSGTQVVNGLNFGTVENVQPTGASITGTVFNDVDRDGKFDAGESGISGRTVYLDLNNNGSRDGNEPQATTNSSGRYTLAGLSAGTYKVRQILPSGFSQTFPTNNFGNNVTLATNQAKDGVNFGSASSATRTTSTLADGLKPTLVGELFGEQLIQ